MIITIQAVEERRDNVDKINSQLKDIKTIIHYDTKRISPFNAFAEMLDVEVEDYRLHLQDDIMLPNYFTDYLPYVKKEMINRKIDVLSLFAPQRKYITEQYKLKNNYVEFPNFLWLQAVIFSKKAISEMREYLKITNEKKHDDVFVANYLKSYNKKAYLHLPAIVQHNVYLGSVMGHRNNSSRMSAVYDNNYIKNFLNE